MSASAVNFVPQSQKQCQVLLQYIESNRAAIAARKTAEYYKEVSVVKQIMREHFAKHPPQLKVKICPWKQLGTSAMCESIAQKYAVPHWDVKSEANPYL